MILRNSPGAARRQRGIALITALLIVSLAVIAATAVVTAGSLAIQRTSTLIETERAWWFATGVDAWVKTILQRDAKQNQFDALTDIWAQPVDFLPIEGGFLSGRVVDLQGKFNLNNFGAADPATFKRWQTVFERLCEQLEIDPNQARAISESIRDWVDADQNPTPYDGAEDNEYLSARPPQVAYRTANRPMQTVTELMAIKGVTKEIYAALLPYVTALPISDAAINVNTAPDPVLRALVEKPGVEFTEFLKTRLEKPIENKGEIATLHVINAADSDAGFYDTKSRFFQLRGVATVGNSRVAIYSLYYRASAGMPVVLARSTDSE